MSRYVRESMLGSRPPAEQVTAQQLLDAPKLATVLTDWLQQIASCKRDPSEPVILAAHNGFSVDWLITYWCMVKAGVQPYEMLKSAGVVAVLDTQVLAKNLPDSVNLPTTAVRRQRQYNNKALLTALTGRPDTDFLWHKAVDDAVATSAWLPAKEMIALLTHPKFVEMNALI